MRAFVSIGLDQISQWHDAQGGSFVITSSEEVIYSSDSVCVHACECEHMHVCVCMQNIFKKVTNRIWRIFMEVKSGPGRNRLHFGDDVDFFVDVGACCRILYHCR